MKISNARLRFAVEMSVKAKAQFMMWVHQVNMVTPMSEAYLLGADMQNTLDEAKVRYNGQEVPIKKYLSCVLDEIEEDDEEEYDKILSEIESIDSLYKYVFSEGVRLADALDKLMAMEDYADTAKIITEA